MQQLLLLATHLDYSNTTNPSNEAALVFLHSEPSNRYEEVSVCSTFICINWHIPVYCICRMLAIYGFCNLLVTGAIPCALRGHWACAKLTDFHPSLYRPLPSHRHKRETDVAVIAGVCSPSHRWLLPLQVGEVTDCRCWPPGAGQSIETWLLQWESGVDHGS